MGDSKEPWAEKGAALLEGIAKKGKIPTTKELLRSVGLQERESDYRRMIELNICDRGVLYLDSGRLMTFYTALGGESFDLFLEDDLSKSIDEDIWKYFEHDFDETAPRQGWDMLTYTAPGGKKYTASISVDAPPEGLAKAIGDLMKIVRDKYPTSAVQAHVDRMDPDARVGRAD